jgi:pimeloyl-ACP methyl ester carboxylesterase
VSLLAWRRGGRAGGPAVVLVHAWAADGASQWEATGWVEALDAAGFALYVPDLPGHGESAGLAPPPGREPAAWTARAMLDDLDRLGVRSFAVVGFADGGILAGHLAVRAPDRVTRLVLIGCDDRRGLPDGKATASALRDSRARLWDPVVAEAVARARLDRRHDLGVLAGWVERAAWPAAPRLASLGTPVLLAVAAGDDEHHARAPRLAKLLHDARLVSVPGDRPAALTSGDLRRQVAAFLQGS